MPAQGRHDSIANPGSDNKQLPETPADSPLSSRALHQRSFSGEENQTRELSQSHYFARLGKDAGSGPARQHSKSRLHNKQPPKLLLPLRCHPGRCAKGVLVARKTRPLELSLTTKKEVWKSSISGLITTPASTINFNISICPRPFQIAILKKANSYFY